MRTKKPRPKAKWGYGTDGAEFGVDQEPPLISYTRVESSNKTYQSTEHTIELGGPPLLRSSQSLYGQSRSLLSEVPKSLEGGIP